jgi:hypothetical protein
MRQGKGRLGGRLLLPSAAAYAPKVSMSWSTTLVRVRVRVTIRVFG